MTESNEYNPINLKQKLKLINSHWQPKVIAQMNDYQFKLVKILGDFEWHKHSDTDEAFIVIAGKLRIDFRDGSVTVNTGELYVVPKGIEHKPYAEHEVQMLLLNPRGLKNTADAPQSERTAQNDVWI